MLIFKSKVKEGLIERVTLQERPSVGEGVIRADAWRESD